VIGRGIGGGCWLAPGEGGADPAGVDVDPDVVGLGLAAPGVLSSGVALRPGALSDGWGEMDPGARLDAPGDPPSRRA
jgi:hypothetical protein